MLVMFLLSVIVLLFDFLLPPLLDVRDEVADENLIDFNPSTINLMTDFGRGNTLSVNFTF